MMIRIRLAKTENSSLKCSEFISQIYEFMFHWLQNWNLLNISMIWDSLFSELKSKKRYNFFLSICFISEKYIEILRSFGVFWKLSHVQGKKVQIKMYDILTYKIWFPVKRSDPDQFFIQIIGFTERTNSDTHPAIYKQNIAL